MKVDQMRVAVVGGGGFVGKHLLQRLRELDIAACAMDISQPTAEPEGHKFYRVDITDLQQVRAAIDDFAPSCVVHLAGWGMSGSPMLSSRCHIINTQGTRHVIVACLQQPAPCALIYLSTYNVVFGGQEILRGCEDQPYFSGQHSDQYAPSKTLAEQAVLEANCSRLRTCVLRPAAIYGPMEERHFPRIVQAVDSGLFLVRIGCAQVDWVHVDNLVQAIELAALKLKREAEECKDRAKETVAGEVFFVSDGTPIGNFDFLQPLCAARGVRGPLLYLPVPAALLLARLAEAAFYLSVFALGPERALEPFLTVPEVLKVGVTHHFSIEKARRILGYEPTCSSEQGARQMAEHYRKCVHARDFFQLVHPAAAVLIAAGMLLLTMFAFRDEDSVYTSSALAALHDLALWLFRSRRNLQLVLLAAHVVHLYEASRAMAICSELEVRAGLRRCWAVQTFLFGFSSLGMLKARQGFVKKSLKKNT